MLFRSTYYKDMHDKITTIEQLATMIQRTMASKEDLANLSGKMESRMENMESVMKDMQEEMSVTREDVRYIRNTMTALVSNDAAQDAAVVNLAERVEILEDRATLAPA